MSNQPTRFSQAQILIAALFAVVLTGKMPESEESPAATQEKGLPRDGYEPGGRYRGINQEVAELCGVSPTMVYEVGSGRETSARILQAIKEAESKRDQLRSAMNLAPITAAERAQFQHGGKYRGIMAVVAKTTGRSIGTVHCVAKGAQKNEELLNAIRIEMAKRDAEIAGKQVSK
jgi:hypothetical protein